MNHPSYLTYLWGQSDEDESEVPVHYPLLAVLAIAASIAPTTWFLPNQYGYLISGSVLCFIIAYGVLFTDVRLVVDSAFLVLIGGYWLGLIAHYLFYSSNSDLLMYILVTPIALVATVIVLPQFVERRQQTFTMGITLLSVAMMLIGVAMLGYTVITGVQLYSWTGEEVMGLYAIRTPSVFSNPNTYGFFMMMGSLAALYTVLERKGIVWIVALGLCLVGLFMSEGDAALLGFGIGSIVILSGRSRSLSFIGLGVGVIAIYAMIQIGHFSQVMETPLMNRVDRWVLSLERLALDPLWGIGFVDAGPEIGGSRGPHNSYLEILLHTGVIAGSLYLGSFIYAVGAGIRRHWTPWTGFVLGTAAGLFAFMTFESLTLGGLSTSSVLLGLIIGLMLLPKPDRDDCGQQSTSTRHLFSIRPMSRPPNRLQSTNRTTPEGSTDSEDHAD